MRTMRFAPAGWPALFLALSFGLSAAEPAPPDGQATPPPHALEARLLRRVRQLTFAGRRSGEGYFSRDGKTMVFQSERHEGNPFYQIYTLDLARGETRRVSPGSGKTTCAWLHPGGQRVLFASSHLDPQARAKQEQELEERAKGTARRYAWDYDPFYDLFTANLDGTELQPLAPALGYDAEGSFSTDGSKILFASNRHAYAEDAKLSDEERKRLEIDPSYFMELYEMDAGGGNLKRLTDAPGYDGGPFYSFDGTRICWRRFAPDGKTAEIWSAAAGGAEPRPLTRLNAMSWAPYFHPSGEYLIFATNLHGFDNFELYLVDAGGARDPLRVTWTPGFDGLPAFAPDGTTLAWTSTRTPQNQSQIFLAEWDHAAAQTLLRGEVLPDRESPDQPVALAATTAPAIRAGDFRKHAELLCSEEMAGRLTGTEGEQRATEYVAGQFRALGLKPEFGQDGYFQPFEFTAGVKLGAENRLAAIAKDTKTEYQTDKDWRPLSFSASQQVDQAGVVFAGYGMAVPEAPGLKGYDSYAHLDVKGKWVLALRFLPEDIAPELRQQWMRFSDLRYKAMQARERGAAGLIVVNGPRAQARSALPALGLDAVVAGGSLPVLAVTDEVAGAWLQAAGKDLAALQKELDRGEPALGFELEDLRLSAGIDLLREKRSGRNVLARLCAGEQPGTSAVLIGAHIDHLGKGSGAFSLARDEEKDAIHFGADDNASGIAALLEIAEFLCAEQRAGRLKLAHDLLFAAWSGEELGLLGSAHYAHQAGDRSEKKDEKTPLELKTIAYLNLDMVGRLREHLVLNGMGSSPYWAEALERANAPLGLAIKALGDSHVPTDATTFYLRGVPVLAGFTGMHPEYHTPRDRPELLNHRGGADVAALFARLAADLAARTDRPVYLRAQKPEPGGTALMRAYLGTIPDYASEAQGVKLSGVREGGPAHRGGARGGDVIVELAGRKIENVYDYTYAIAALKIGEKVKLVVLRDGQRVELEVVPESRK